jgi:hypothetical protein
MVPLHVKAISIADIGLERISYRKQLCPTHNSSLATVQPCGADLSKHP